MRVDVDVADVNDRDREKASHDALVRERIKYAFELLDEIIDITGCNGPDWAALDWWLKKCGKVRKLRTDPRWARPRDHLFLDLLEESMKEKPP